MIPQATLSGRWQTSGRKRPILVSVMVALTLTSVAPVTLSAISALRPAPAVVVPPAPENQLPGSPDLSFKDLVQVLLRQSLQTATAFPTAEPATGSAALAAQATTSLLAALNPPQATATTTAVADAITNPAAVSAPTSATAATSAPTATPASPLPAEVPATQDAFAASSSLDFALGTALRFGAGVAALAGPAAAASPEGTGLVRDAMAVPRVGNLQAHAGGPGPEAFARPQATVTRVLRTYDLNPATSGPGQLDLFA